MNKNKSAVQLTIYLFNCTILITLSLENQKDLRSCYHVSVHVHPSSPFVFQQLNSKPLQFRCDDVWSIWIIQQSTKKNHILCCVCLAPEAFQAPHSPWARGWEMEDWSTTRYEFRARNLPKEAFALCFCIKYACVSEVQAIVHVFLPTSSITGEGRVLREIFRNVSVIYVKLIKNTTALW